MIELEKSRRVNANGSLREESQNFADDPTNDPLGDFSLRQLLVEEIGRMGFRTQERTRHQGRVFLQFQ